MRKAVWLGICTLAMGFGATIASADVITIAVTGHVTQVNDSSLGVTVGQAVTATYTYDSSAPASGTTTTGATAYPMTSPPAEMSVSVTGGSTYQSDISWTFQVAEDAHSFIYTATRPSSNGSSATIFFEFFDGRGVWLSGTSSLPTTAPFGTVLAGTGLDWPPYIGVQPAGSSGFAVQIETAALVPSITVSPANSSFISQQSFDAVLLLSRQFSVTSMQASVGGTSINFSYPGTCQLAAATSAQRTALICPNAAAVLAGLGVGLHTINWLITLADGTTLQQSVIWNLIL